MPLLTVCLTFAFALLGECVLLHPREMRALLAPLRTHAFYIRTGAICLLVFLTTALILTDFTAPLRFTPSVLLTTLASCAVFSLLSLARRLHSREERTSRRIPLALISLLLLSLFCELFVFNFRAFETMDYTPTDMTDRLIFSNVESEEPDGEGFYTTVHKSKTVYIFFGELDVRLDSLQLVLEAECDGATVSSLQITPLVSDEGSSVPYSVPSKTVYTALPSTSYIYFNLSGNCRSLRLSVDGELERLAVRAAVVNSPTPLYFSLTRFASLFLIFALAYAIRPTSRLYRITLAPFDRPRRAVTYAAILLVCVLLFAIAASGNFFLSLMAPWQAQYQQLADAFLNGHLHLFRETPPDFLLSMENPYDTALRGELSAATGEDYYWDAAYFGGNYYVYFGVLPCLLLYLPFRALTGGDLPNGVAVLFFACLVTVAVFMLVWELLHRYADPKRFPLLTYILLSVLLLTGGGLVSACTVPDMYTVPILSGLGFGLLGLALWLRSLRGERIRRIPLFLGSLSMAAVAACRPQLLLLAFLAFPIFWQAMRERKLFSRTSVTETVLALFPFVLVAAPLMWYNAARFGSPFDFGANYNLTTNDMTLRGFRVERLGLGFWHYLVQLPRYVTVFPFLRACDLDTVFRGVTVYERIWGGIFTACPFALFSVFLYARRESMKKRSSYPIALYLLGAGVVIALFDALAAGILQRYFLDFSPLILLAALLVFADMSDTARGARRLALRRAFLLTFAASSVYRLFLYWAESGALSHLIQFWD